MNDQQPKQPMTLERCGECALHQQLHSKAHYHKANWNVNP